MKVAPALFVIDNIDYRSQLLPSGLKQRIYNPCHSLFFVASFLYHSLDPRTTDAASPINATARPGGKTKLLYFALMQPTMRQEI
jgi:hypothetical protein